MTTIKTGKGEFLMVEVPEDAYDIFIGYFSGGLCYRREYKPEQNIIKLPPGQYTFLCTSKNISEEDAGKIVEKVVVKPKFVGDKSKTFFYDYVNKFYIYEFASQSFTSLLKHYQLSAPNYAILKVINTKQ